MNNSDNEALCAHNAFEAMRENLGYDRGGHSGVTHSTRSFALTTTPRFGDNSRVALGPVLTVARSAPLSNVFERTKSIDTRKVVLTRPVWPRLLSTRNRFKTSEAKPAQDHPWKELTNSAQRPHAVFHQLEPATSISRNPESTVMPAANFSPNLSYFRRNKHFRIIISLKSECRSGLSGE